MRDDPAMFVGLASPHSLLRLPIVLATVGCLTILVGNAFSGPRIQQQQSASQLSQEDYVKSLRQKAERGDATAQRLLGLRLQLGGLGVSQDYAQAAAWWSKAAKQGDPLAQFQLGFMYARGQGVPLDQGQAAAWLRKAAEQGLPVAQFQLGSWYAAGQHVRQDYIEALKWLNLGTIRTALATQKAYSETRDRIAQEMTPAQTAEAQKRATEWVAAFEKRMK
jgi:TPR repeat protein